jgi:hypothetical protein
MSDDTIQNEQDQSIQLWEKQIGESDKAFNAFVVYRDLPGLRTYQKAADKLGCSHTNVRQWASRWVWKNRVDAFDRFADEEDRYAMAKNRLEMRKRHANIGMTLQSLAVRGIQELQAKVAAGTPLGLEPAELSKFLDVGARMEARAYGEDRDSRFTQIIVSLGDTADELEANALTLDLTDTVVN